MRGAHENNGDEPEPLVPADVDLRDFGFMPVDVQRMRDSRIVDAVSGEEFRAAFLLWCASWHQVPAASIPDDEIELAKLAGYGRVVREWKKVSKGALYGFVRCRDGRLYHPVVAEKALEGWESKLRHAYDKMVDRVRKANKQRDGLPPIPIPTFEEWKSAGRVDPIPPEKQGSSGGNPDGADCTSGGNTNGADGGSAGIPPENALKGQGQGQGEGEEREKTSSSRASAQDADDPQVPKSWGRWAEWWRAERGIEVDPHDMRDRKRFVPLATSWIERRVSYGLMRRAIERAEREAKEPIAYLPAYADRCLASVQQGAPSIDYDRMQAEIERIAREKGIAQC